MSSLRQENEELRHIMISSPNPNHTSNPKTHSRRMITKRMDAIPTENPNQVGKMKAKLERATPFGRARRRLGDQDHAILAGQGNLMKEVMPRPHRGACRGYPSLKSNLDYGLSFEARTWSGAEMNAYDTTEPGPLTQGYEHQNRPRS